MRCPTEFAQRIEAIDHRAAYFQIHFALDGLPEYAGPYEILNEGDLRHNVTFFGTAEQMQRDFEGCVRGLVPDSPSFNLSIPTLRDPDLAPPGKHVASSFAFYSPIGSNRMPTRPGSATRWPTASWPRSPQWRPTSPTSSSASSTTPPTPTS